MQGFQAVRKVVSHGVGWGERTAAGLVEGEGTHSQ